MNLFFRKTALASAFFAMLACLSAAAEKTPQTLKCVPGAKLYASAEAGADVALVMTGESELELVSDKGIACEVVAPEELPVWVSSAFILEDGTLSKDAVFRCGAGVAYDEYSHEIQPGAKPEILEKTSGGAWLKIAHPGRVFCFVLPGSVTRPAAVSAKTEKETAQQAKSEDKYIPGDESNVSVEGRLSKLKTPVGGAEYELTLKFSGEKYHLCYVTSGKLNLAIWSGRVVRIDGVQKWVKGIQKPFVCAEKISPSWK